jgi:hypothetical protein
MERRTVWMVVGIIAVASIVASVLLFPVPVEEEPDPFHATLLLEGIGPNATDASRLDAAIWVAVSAGEPKPRWDVVDVVATQGTLNETLAAPALEVNDLDGDGHLTEGDLLHLSGIPGAYWNGTVVILTPGGSTIGSVELSNVTSD